MAVVDSRMEISLLHAAIQLPFTMYLQHGNGKPFDMFQPGSVYPGERVCMCSLLLI